MFTHFATTYRTAVGLPLTNALSHVAAHGFVALCSFVGGWVLQLANLHASCGQVISCGCRVLRSFCGPLLLDLLKSSDAFRFAEEHPSVREPAAASLMSTSLRFVGPAVVCCLSPLV